MSEILRAVMDDSCIFSHPCFYTIDFTSAAASPSKDTGRIITNQDRFFLMTAIVVGYENIYGAAERFSPSVGIFDALTSEIITSTVPASVAPANQVSAPLLNWSLNSLYTMPEYKLWRPASTIGATITNVSAGGNTYRANMFSVTLMGIEYGV